MPISQEQARIRNLKMKITHWVIEKGGDLDTEFTSKKLKEELYFKESDLKISKKLFDEDKYLNQEIKADIEEYKNNYNKNKDTKDDDLKELYNKLKDYFINNGEKIEFDKNISKAIDLIKKLHWKYMPIYREQFIINNGHFPEDIDDYYNHFHAIEVLYWYIFDIKRIDWKSTDGDINLDKDMELKIYTVRWGHEDYYSIKRTVDGWYIKGLPVGTGECDKDGKGSFIKLLEHDGVCYPKEGLNYALSYLWKQADTTNMTVDELQERINDISTWLKEVELATHTYQPSWCSYY